MINTSLNGKGSGLANTTELLKKKKKKLEASACFETANGDFFKRQVIKRFDVSMSSLTSLLRNKIQLIRENTNQFRVLKINICV